MAAKKQYFNTYLSGMAVAILARHGDDDLIQITENNGGAG
jgi:hypothetical protein